MKPIKVDNKALIEAALKAVNGKATTHTCTTVNEVLEFCGEAEVELHALGLNKAERVGAIVHGHSGSKVANAYKYNRDGTSISVQRKSSGWVLIDCKSITLYPSDGHKLLISLTPSQRDIAVAKLLKRFSVQQLKQTT